MKLVLIENKEIFFELLPGSNLVGRWDADASSFPEIDLDDLDTAAKVSRKHALIWVDEDQKAVVEDIGSLNGTWVNKNQLVKGNKVEIKVGDEVVFGALKFLVVEK